MRVEQYSIGFPPRIFKFKFGETVYSIGAIPLGGYVKIAGMIDESLDLEKMKEEIVELEDAIEEKNPEEIESEIGDIIFSVVNLARFRKVSAEDALRKTINKFISRFQYIEEKLAKMGRTVYQSSLQEMDQLWEESKNHL